MSAFVDMFKELRPVQWAIIATVTACTPIVTISAASGNDVAAYVLGLTTWMTTVLACVNTALLRGTLESARSVMFYWQKDQNFANKLTVEYSTALASLSEHDPDRAGALAERFRRIALERNPDLLKELASLGEKN